MSYSLFKNKHIAIIGTSGALGQAFCKALADDAAHIYGFSRSETTIKHANLSSHHCDITDETSIADAAATITTPLDAVIVTTGVLHNDTTMPEKSLRELKKENFETNFSVNCIGPALIAKHFIPHLTKEAPSVFAALSARVGSISDNHLGGWHSYRASKAALNMVLKNLAIETARKNKNAIILGLHPGTVDSNLSKPFQASVPEGKLFSPEQSTTYLLEVIQSKTPADSGKIFDWKDEEITP